MTARTRLADAGWAAAVAVVILLPLLLGRGYALRGDMVFVPDQPWKDAWLGLDGAVARFVPGDAVVWALGRLLPGDLVQKALLTGAFVVGGAGVARLAAGWTLVARWSAVTFFLWNPWTLERLSIGQWPMLVGYAALPWVVRGAERLPGRAGWRALAGGLAVAAVSSPPSGLLALAVAVVAVAGRSRGREVAGVLGLGVVVNLPWLVPSLLAPQQPQAASDQFAAFAARGETGLGAFASVWSLGGIWKSSIIPVERTFPAVLALAAVLTVVALCGLGRLPRQRRATFLPIGLLAGLLLGVASLTAVDAVAAALGTLAERVAALGLLRDSHRLLAPWALVLAVGFGGAVDWAWHRAAPGREAWRALAALGCVLPALLLPSLAFGLGGRLEVVDYPTEWREMQRLPAATTVVLPWHGTYRGFDWNDDTAMLDPAPRLLPGDVLIDDRHYLRGTVLGTEDPLVARVTAALAEPPAAAAAGLRALGVSRVVVEKGNGVRPEEVPAGHVVHDGRWLQVVDLGAAEPLRRARPPRAAVIAGDLIALLTIVVVFVVGSVTRPRWFGYRFRSSRTGNREGS